MAETAQRLVADALGDALPEFAYHRFDAQEMFRAASGEALSESVDEFQIACQTVPFLTGQYVVRLDHLECVKMTGRAAANLAGALEAIQMRRCTWEGRSVWAEASELPAGQSGTDEANLRGWVGEVTSLPGGQVLLHVAAESPQFLVPNDAGHELLGLKAFLRLKVKGKIVFADEEGESAAAAEPASAVGRLHALLEKLIANPPPGCRLIFTAEGREGDLSAPLLRLLKRHGTVEKFVTYDDYAPLDWLRKESRARGLALNRPAMEQLLRHVGNDLGQLASELDKLALLFPAGTEPDEEALLAALHGNSRHSPFQITEKLGTKDLDGTLAVLDQLMRESPHEHPVLIGILARYFRQLMRIHAMNAAGAGEAELASQLKLPPFIARKLVRQSRQYSATELERMLRALAELDIALKRNARLAPLLFKDLMMAICGGRFLQEARPLQYLGKAGMN
ncbi:MAG: DNA polymerase III subunit delta [SAR324 cluster bacterium]|nr:DNA polymerase III subunit delta [SAR324 cluster bacterium]